MSLQRDVPPDPRAVLRQMGFSEELWMALQSGNIHELIKLPDVNLVEAMNSYSRSNFHVPLAANGSDTTSRPYNTVLRGFLEFMKTRWRGIPEDRWGQDDLESPTAQLISEVHREMLRRAERQPPFVSEDRNGGITTITR